jgi:hypothetical protein
MLAVVNAADTCWHLGFKRFAKGPVCSLVAGPTAVRTAFLFHAHSVVGWYVADQRQAPETRPRSRARSFLQARRPQRNAGGRN